MRNFPSLVNLNFFSKMSGRPRTSSRTASMDLKKIEKKSGVASKAAKTKPVCCLFDHL